MKKQIIKRGYMTYCLTDSDGHIYNEKGEIINWLIRKDSDMHFYWSEVYCEPNFLTTIIRRGELLVSPSAERLSNLHKQSKINCN